MPTLLETFDLLDRFEEMLDGWHFGEGVRIDKSAINLSREFLSVGFDLNHDEANAFPGINGEVQLRFYHGDDTLDLTFEIDGSITVVIDKDDEQVLYKEDVTYNQATKFLKEFTYERWNLSELSVQSTTTLDWVVLPVWHLNNRQMAVSQSLAGIVPKKTVSPSVHISEISTRMFREHPLSSGISQMNGFPTLALSR